MSNYTKKHPKFFENIREVNGIKEKRCTKCGEWKPATTEDFYMRNKQKPEKGFNSECKECSIKASFKRNKDNPEMYKTCWTKNNHQPYRKKAKTESARQHRSSGKRKIWENNNRDKLRLSSIVRQMTKKHEITKSQWEACKNYFNYHCAYCGLDEQKHKELYGEQLHREHVIYNGSNKIDNCVTSCKPCNSSKGEYEMEEWYRQQEFFDENKLKKIYQWLNEDYKKFE